MIVQTKRRVQPHSLCTPLSTLSIVPACIGNYLVALVKGFLPDIFVIFFEGFRLRFRIREQRQRAGQPDLVRDFPREGPQERFEIIISLPDVRII
jgi:hypothetical protein